FINSHYWDAGVAGQRLVEALHVPHLHTPHSLGIWKKRQMEKDHPDDAANFEKRYNFKERIHHERLLYAAADLVVATTPQQADLLVQDYDLPEERCPMIPPGYDDHRFYPVGEASRQAIRQRLGFTGNVVFGLGRLARNKGYDLLIHGFDALTKREPKAMLHLAVGGENLNAHEEKLLAELKDLTASLHLTDRVRFGGFIPDADLADYYRAADVFVLSSRYEPFGMTAIEAMACGTPTIVTLHGGLWKALTFGRNALFTDPFDKEDLGIMMLKLFRLPRLRARLSRMGAYKARSLFTWAAIAQQLVALAEHHTQARVDMADTEWDEPWTDTD
ncbi:MAG: glycosyltransferase, partial [Gammaproteobacteria bacterium]